MKKTLVLVGALLCGSAALADSTTIDWTTSDHQSYDTHAGPQGDKAVVTQKLNLNLPQATGLHLTVNTLDFNIADIGKQDNTWACVYGNNYQGNDVSDGYNGGWSGQNETLPLGVAYTTAGLPFGKINVPGKKVTSYPPIEFTGSATDGKLVEGSKNHFVCFRIFKIQKFSNLGYFDLNVTRSGGPSAKVVAGGTPDGTFQVYMQDNPCYSWNRSTPPGDVTGLYEIKPGSTVHLIPTATGVGTTGALASMDDLAKQNCLVKDPNGNYQGKSWLDDLVVVAVKVDGDKAGMNTTTLTYTLQSSASVFKQ